MIDFYFHTPEGKIIQTGHCLQEHLEYQELPGCVLQIGSANFKTHYHDSIRGAVPFPQKPSEFHSFDYSTKSWKDPRSLDELIATKWEEIKVARSEAEFGGFLWDGSYFDSDALSQSRIQGAIQLASMMDSFEVTWTLADNSLRVLSKDDLLAVGNALGQHIATQHVKARLLRMQIESATSPEQLINITW